MESQAQSVTARWEVAGPYPVAPQTGTRSRGATYERRVGKRLARLCDSLGWTFRDHPWISSPEGWMQPDFVLESPGGGVIIVECKLTWVDTYRQTQKYKRALRSMGQESSVLLVTRHLTHEAPAPIHEMEDMSDGSVWHLLL